MNRRPSKRRGFTLIELVVVIIILGLLAAVAVPKFIALGQSARLASVKSLAGALQTVVTTVRMACMMDSVCSSEAGQQQHFFVVANRFVAVNYDGYISGGYIVNLYAIDTMVDYSGYTASVVFGGTWFSLDGSPDPANCGVQYYGAWTGPPVQIQQATSGC